MKHIIRLVLLTFLLAPGLMVAQDLLSVVQVEKQMSRGTQTGFTVDIPQAKLKNVVNAWKKYIRRGETATSVESRDDELQVGETSITNVSPEAMSVYAQVRETEKGIRLTAFYAEDDTNFISSDFHAEKAAAVEKMMKDFARAQYRLAVESELEEGTKNLEALEWEKDRMHGDIESSNKNIGSFERKIKHARNKIETNGAEQSKRSAEVANQKEIVRSTTPKTATYDLEDRKLGSLEKELKKLEKEGERLHSDIDGWNADIRKEQRNIEKLEDSIKEKKESILAQKEKLKVVKKKLDNIR